MMMRYFLMTILLFLTFNLAGQIDSLPIVKKERLDFAKGYFELGGTFTPSFTGRRILNNEIVSFDHPASLNSTFYWGAFHFWGHAEFYVSFPLKSLNLSTNDQTDLAFTHYTVTGGRYYPWAVQDKKLRPYIGVSWSSLDFKQVTKSADHQPRLQKNFSWVADIGILYQYKKIAARLGVNFFPDNQWDYPIAKTQFEKIQTPRFGIQLGLIYTTDFTKKTGDPKINERWNSSPTLSNLSMNATSFGDFFIAAGPSISFSLVDSDYNNSKLPYLSQNYTSNSYYDLAIGYQFNKLNGFTTLSFRNPTFEQTAFDTKQLIKKTSITLEAVKFLTDYSGFAPFIGLNIAYDNIKYSESTNSATINQTYNNIESGITFGWDIVPGKTEEFLILRTNLRWYPFSSFQLEGKKFNFNQLEYNLIQVVFYPARFLKSQKEKKTHF